MIVTVNFAVTLTAWRGGRTLGTVLFGIVTVVFIYALVSNVYERPDGITIALFFVGAIIAISLVSRVQRSTELRQERIDVVETASSFIEEAARRGEIHFVAHRRRNGTEERILFLEIQVEDASEFTDVLEVKGVEVGGR
jgi:uncharacterized membrane protein YcjF (UPF0283 family)